MPFLMRQFENKNPPKFENDFKWLTLEPRILISLKVRHLKIV